MAANLDFYPSAPKHVGPPQNGDGSDCNSQNGHKHNLCLKGYQNELKYQHSDGSYSAFGRSDRSGSLW